MIGFANLENSLSWGPLSMAMSLTAAGRNESAPVDTGYTLKSLFKKTPWVSFKGNGKQKVSCLISDSRRVIPGAVFFAVEGLHKDGNSFLEEAIDRGAVAIVSSMPAPFLCPVPYIQVVDVRRALAEVSRLFYKAPDEAMRVLGITGTNGKTTTSMILQALLAKEDRPVGLIGTVRYDLGKRTLPSYKTTPESVDLFAMLAQMRDHACQEAVMEVSSHGLAQNRVYGLHFETVAFLGLTQDHIDYHGSMEAYFEVKARLFNGKTGCLPRHTVLNLDDSRTEALRREIPSKVKIYTFSVQTEADFYVQDLKLLPNKSTFTLVYPGGTARVHLPLPGLYNVQNALAALAIYHSLGKDVVESLSRLEQFKGAPGRMECVSTAHPFNVFVDYAHTDDALKQALGTLKTITPGKVHVVFGCGGDRDRSKRPQMMQVAVNNADSVFVTSDNPRSESIEAIFNDMKEGVVDLIKAQFISDRKEAIYRAIQSARAGDSILIAGKGHETYQNFGDTILPFDDAQVAKECISQLS